MARLKGDFVKGVGAGLLKHEIDDEGDLVARAVHNQDAQSLGWQDEHTMENEVGSFIFNVQTPTTWNPGFAQHFFVA